MKCPENMIASMPFAEIRQALPGIPLDEDGPVFRAPWEAQAFAMTLALYEKGFFTWPQWAECLTQTISQAQATGDPDTGENYYEHWLAALELIVTLKKLVNTEALAQRKQAWHQAALHTPHGQPIIL